MSSESPDLAALLGEAMLATAGRINVALPAQVVVFDAIRQAVTVQPTVWGRYHDPATGALLPYQLPQIANVPVAFPSGGGCAITWPLLPGDVVFLVCADRSLDEWKALGAPSNVPLDVRRHDLTDVVAIPGLRPFSAPVPATGWAAGALVVEGADVRLGSSLAASPVALAPLVAAVMAALQVWLDTHTHTGVTTGSGVSGPPAVPSPAPADTGAVRVKAL